MTTRSQADSDDSDALSDLLHGLSDVQRRLLATMAEAMKRPLITKRGQSDIVDDAFAEAFGNFLLLHHAIHEEPLNKTAFEYLFRSCSEASGSHAVMNDHRGSATYDVVVDGIRWSLKTEAAVGIHLNIVKIEKLMEARWIRECTNPAKCAASVRREVAVHMAGYDRILILRAFRLPGSSIRYDLVEPPKSAIVDALNAVTPNSFTKEGRKESYGANLLDDTGSRIFRILLDSSVEKIRIWFNLPFCHFHGSWLVASIVATPGELRPNDSA